MNRHHHREEKAAAAAPLMSPEAPDAQKAEGRREKRASISK